MMRQDVYPDPIGPHAYDTRRGQMVTVHLCTPLVYAAVTRTLAPPSPASAAEYTAAGLPWFALYDEGVVNDVNAPEVLAAVKSLEALRLTEAVVPLPVEAKVITIPGKGTDG